MAETLADALIDIFLVWADAKTKPDNIDVIGNGNTVVLDPVCSIGVVTTGSISDSNPAPKQCAVTVTCNDTLQVYDFTNNCLSVSDVFSVNDPTVGQLTVSFTESSENTLPFPGNVWINTDEYTIESGGQVDPQGFPLSSCDLFRTDEIVQGTDCDGDVVTITMCSYGFPDLVDRIWTPENMQEYGFEYYIALPKLSASKNLGCEGS